MAYATGVSSAPTTEFFRHIGAGEFEFGLLGGLPLVMISLQFAGAIAAGRLRRRKKLFMVSHIASRLAYLPIAFIPLLFPSARLAFTLPLMIGLVALSSAMTNLGSPSWFSWMADLIPRRVLNHYWGVRQRWMFAVWTAASLIITFLTLAWAPPVTVLFPVLVTVAVALGVTDILLFAKVKEPENLTTGSRESLDVLIEPFRHREYRSFLIASAAETAAIMMAASFMQIYVLKELGLPLWQVTLIWCVYGVGNAIASPMWGRLADRHGHKPIMVVCMAFKPLAAAVFAVITKESALWVLPVFFLLDSSWNAGISVARNGYMLKIAPRENRSMFVAAITGITGITAGLATIAGGWYLKTAHGLTFALVGHDWSGYQILFLSSALLRVLCLFLTVSVREPKSSPPVHLVQDMADMLTSRLAKFPVGFYRRWR